MARRKVDFDAVREIGLELPDVVDATTGRGAALKLRGRILACKAIHRSAEPSSLMIRVGSVERERLLAADPAVYYLTDHYEKHGCILLRLDRVTRTALRNALKSGWRFVMENT